jgi:hypothetical protein
MPELIQTLKAIKKSEEEERKFLAALQGKNLDGDEEEEREGPSFDDIQRKVLGIETDKNDILSLQGSFAAQAGFGIGAGLGYSKE